MRYGHFGNACVCGCVCVCVCVRTSKFPSCPIGKCLSLVPAATTPAFANIPLWKFSRPDIRRVSVCVCECVCVCAENSRQNFGKGPARLKFKKGR